MPAVAAQVVTVQQDPANQMDRQRELNRLYSTGYKYYQIQDYAGAIPAFKRYTELDSTNTQAWYFLGTCYTMTEQWDRVVDTYQRILRLEPDDVNALQNLAFAYNEMGETAKVVEVYERIVELVPEDQEYRDYLLNLYRRDQNSEGMIRLLEQQALRNPDDPTVHQQLAEIHRRQGNVEAQINSLEVAIAGDPANAENLLKLGRLYLTDMNQPCEAARVFDLLARSAPEDPVAWRFLGRARERCGDAEGAVVAYQTTLDLKPDEIRVYSELGQVLAMVGRYEEGVASVEKAIELAPEDGYAYVSWGDILRDQGMATADTSGVVPYDGKIILEAAIEKYRQALDIGGLSPEIAQYAQRQADGLEPFRRTTAEIFMQRAKDRIPPPPRR